MQGEEEHLINQWLEKRDQVDVSLSQIEEQIEQFGEVPVEMNLLQAALEEHEVCFCLCFYYLDNNVAWCIY